MEKNLVLKDVLYASKIGGGLISGLNQVNQLADGAVAIFTNDGTMVTAANVATSLLNAKTVTFYVGTGDATIGALKSSDVDRMSADVTFKAYTAAVAMVSYIGSDGTNGALNLPSPLIPGDTVAFKIIELTEGTQPPASIENYEYMIQDGDTQAIIMAAIAAKALNSALATVAVVASDVGLSVTAKDKSKTFALAAYGSFSNATILQFGLGLSVLPVFGDGLATQVLKMEEDGMVEYGKTNPIYLSSKFFSFTSRTVSSTTYDIYVIYWKTYGRGGTNSMQAVEPKLIISMPTAAATITQTNFNTIMTNAFGVNRINSETGSA